MRFLGMLLVGAALTLFSNSAAQAQMTYDFSRYTCEQFLTAPLGERVINAAWYSGYYNGKRNNTKVDLTNFEANVNAVVASCEKNPKQTIMQAANKLLDGKK